MLGNKSDVTEEDLREMVYLEQVCTRNLDFVISSTYQVISEGLRYMVLPNTSRYCTKAYKIPDSDFTIPKGMKVMIPTVRLVFATFSSVLLATICSHFFEIISTQAGLPRSILKFTFFICSRLVCILILSTGQTLKNLTPRDFLWRTRAT